jgi:hypothetical protein
LREKKVKLREEEEFIRTNATDSSLFPAKVPSIVFPKATIEEEKSAPLSETVSGTTFATAIETTSRNKSASLSSHRSFAVKAFIFTPTSLPPFRRREGEKQFCGVKMHRENARRLFR